VLVLHYRGTWGSAGTFSWAHAEEDARAALALLRARAAEWRIDAARLAVVGHSVGGWVALRAAAADPAVAAAAALAGTNLGRLGALARGDDAIQAAMREAVRAVSDPDAGPVRVADLEALVRDVVTGAEAYDLTRTAAGLRERPVLLVGATEDREAPLALHHVPLVGAFEAAGAERLTHAVLAADHAFTDTAPALHAVLVEWTARALRPRVPTDAGSV
jgi:dienelactone hydrolase